MMSPYILDVYGEVAWLKAFYIVDGLDDRYLWVDLNWLEGLGWGQGGSGYRWLGFRFGREGDGETADVAFP